MLKVYKRINWENKPSETTPLNASNLNAMDLAIDLMDTRIVELYQDLSKIPKFKLKVVNELPLQDIDESTIYLLKSYDDTGNLYSEFIYVNNEWEYLGSQAMDLSGYAEKATTLEGYGITDGATKEDVNRLSEEIADLSGGSLVEPKEDDIPKVYFTGALPTSKNDGELPVTIHYKSKTEEFDYYATLKVQGGSSVSYPKKNFTLKMYEDEALENKVKREFKKWGNLNKWVLKAHWIDHSHVRNVGTAKIWSKIVKARSDYNSLPEELRNSPNNGATDGFTVKVFVNGVYQGLYEWIVPKDKLFGQDSDIATHSIMNSEYNNQPTCAFATTTPTIGGNWSEELQDTMSANISTSFANFIKFVAGSTDEEFVANAENYFDVQSVMDFDIFARVFCIVDNLCRNQLFFTYDGVKWYEGVWDLDAILGLPPTTRGFFAYNTEFQTGYVAYKDYGVTNLLYQRVETLFIDRFKERYAELRSTVLSVENIIDVYERLMDVITTYDGLLKEDYASTTGDGKFTGIPYTSENNIQQIRNFVAKRIPYMDEVVANIGSEDEPEIPDVPDVPGDETIPATGITLNQASLSFTDETPITLTATVTPNDTTETITWESSNVNVATVSNGVVTPIWNGDCVITATCGSHSAYCSVSVSGLVDLYTELSYIESTGTQYIDTGISNGTNASYEIKMNPLAAQKQNYEQYFAGSKTPTIPKIYREWGKVCAVFGAARTELHAGEDKARVYEYKSTKSIYVDGVEMSLSNDPSGNGWGDESWYVCNSHGEPTLMSSMRLYYLKMWTDGELVRDFVPVRRKSDSAIGLYDNVTETFFANVGTGEFIGA